MTRGSYTRDFYFIPTIIYHNGDGIYTSLELAWLKWYIGFCFIHKSSFYFFNKSRKESENKELQSKPEEEDEWSFYDL